MPAKTLYFLVFLALMASACQACSRHVVIANPPIVIGPDGGDPCSVACSKLRLNGCAGIHTDADEAICAQQCATDQAQGAASQLSPQCIIAATSNDQINACDSTLNCQGVAGTSVTVTAPDGGIMGARRPETPAHCSARGALPDPDCTPGDVETTDLKIICGQSTKERRNVPSSVHREAFAEYGIEYPQPAGAFEVDHLISLELGGSNDIKNLWPEAAEPTPGFHEKDKVENELHKRVCAGTMTLAAAQHVIATDWLSVWKEMGR